MTKESFDPPPGPPPGYSQGHSYASTNQGFTPPPGPPPSYLKDHQKNASASMDQEFAPPPGPPPSAKDPQPPEYAPWLAVPDTSLLPPAPAMLHQVSPTANATKYSANQAKDWCRQNRLWPPGQLSPTDNENIRTHGYVFGAPGPNFAGDLARRQVNTWSVRTRRKCEDCVLLTTLPLYSALRDDPLRNQGKSFTAYFEIRVIRMGSDDAEEEGDAGIAIGYAAPPYPPFRLPGWERASLGVHGDDGRRYIDDDGGGQDFTTYFKNGETVGIGMHIRPAQYSGRKRDIEVFFTREGKKDGGWNMYEERDQTDTGSVFGLEGDYDLMAACGIFGQVEFEVRFRRDEWLYRP